MSLNLLGISVGNTRTRIGAFIDGHLVDQRAFENTDPDRLVSEAEAAFDAIRHKADPVILAATVNPTISERVFEKLGSRLNQPVLRVDRDMPIPIGRQLDREAIVGEDRLLNAAAAFDVLKQACVVIDAGTALTIDFVDGAGTFHGGAIAPGAQLMLDSLHQRTAQLPEVEMAQPDEPIGHNTREAMLAGVFYGSRGIVREMTEQIAERVGSYPMIVATGGNAPLLFTGFELVERIVSDLTLMGLAVCLRRAREEAD